MLSIPEVSPGDGPLDEIEIEMTEIATLIPTDTHSEDGTKKSKVENSFTNISISRRGILRSKSYGDSLTVMKNAFQQSSTFSNLSSML